MKKVAIGALVVGLTLRAVFALADDKAPKLAVCVAAYDYVWKAPSGATMGMCGAKKPGGKITYLRSFEVVSVIDPATDKPMKLLVGIQ